MDTRSRLSKSTECTILKPKNGHQTFTRYFAGSGFTEDIDNPGNLFPFAHRQSTYIVASSSTCEALADCAYFVQQIDYKSFDLHFYQSQGMWQCTAYFDKNSDSTFFSVKNYDVSEAYLYST
ncbi:MAG: hypothetical protein M1814_005060 [Vezdaea aestivalis]|nr:MAG: hypothetical protein M1814_005060 [Vezdaea aestivalis]